MTKGLFIGNSHANGGIPSEIAETGTKIEIEGNEYYICNEAYNSDDVFEFKNKTNKEILDYIYTEFACKLNQDIMHTGDFIVCKVVVADNKKKNRKGTIKQILNEMQGEKNCKVESGNNYKNGGAILLAPNGNKSNLTPEQYKLVRTPAFKSWFGDWENDPENASKVVDHNGEPLVVYHSTDREFNVFELKGLSDGFFFTKNIDDEEFSQKGWLKSKGLTYEQAIEKGYDLRYEYVKPYFLKIKQFYKKENVKNSSWSTPYFENAVIEFAKRNKKNDGVEFLREIDNKQIIVAFEPNQIKLADGTNTTFDSSNPDIRFDEGGNIKTQNNDMEKINFIEGNYYYYKNSIMSEAIKVKLIEKQEWENGNIESLTFKKPDGSTLNLKNSDIKYITDVRKEADGYSFEKKLNSFINNFINESPKQILGIINSIDKKESKGVSNLTFTEEVKEGRARKFNTSNPLKLKGKEFSYDGITLTINDIKYIGENIQPSDYNEYVDFDYSLTYSIKYDNNDMERELEKGIAVEQEHRDTLEKIASGDISVDEAIKQTAEDHIAENPSYYDELEKIEKKSDNKEIMNINESFYINRELRGSGIERIIISIAKNDPSEQIKKNIEIVMSNPNYNAPEKWQNNIENEIYEYEEKINNINLENNKWLRTGGDYIKKSPEYKKRILDIEALNKLIEVANSIKDFNSLSIFLDKKESEIKTDIESYKNPYEVNKAIEKLLDQKGDSKDYSSKELEFISYYSGYGGLEKFGEIGKERLKGLMYEFYTPDAVVKKMWALAYKYGYGTIADNSVFEPSVGIGAFLKYAPSNVRIVANEINEYSAKICEILYPQAKVELKYFEQNFIKNNLSIKSKIYDLDKYSLVIGNPPYGVLNSKYIGMGEDKFTTASNYTEYFITRGLDLLVQDGLLIYIVGAEQYNGGSLFLDSGLSKVKEMIFDKADLVDAYRLPVNIFERTGVSSEIVVFKKR